MENLYPLKFEPIFKEKIWGLDNLNKSLNKKIDLNKKIGESWEISAISDNISVVSNGFLAENNLEEIIEIYMGNIVGDKVFDKFGIEFPLLIKFIDANEVLSIQVHPDNEIAKERHNAFGKTEMWYIVDAKQKAELISGFNKETNMQEYKLALSSGNLKNILNFEKVKKDDVYFIPAGRVHAIGAGIVLAEIQQTSDITYRIYDWGRKDDNGNYRELHTDLAVDVIDYGFYTNYKTDYKFTENKTSNILECEFFKTNILEFDKTVEKDYFLIDSFVVYICLEGEFEIDFASGKEICKKGETILLPAVLKNIKLIPKRKSKLLEVYIA
ncbi:MAG: class I mannose-6-phosphate isomerase [Bacteroidales bacterium]|nr:class I mannose-6-phosphate isomerase [Bacteroidales bacterium]